MDAGSPGLGRQQRTAEVCISPDVPDVYRQPEATLRKNKKIKPIL